MSSRFLRTTFLQASTLLAVALASAAVLSCADEPSALDHEGDIGLNLIVQEPYNLAAFYYEITLLDAQVLRDSVVVDKGGEVSLRIRDLAAGTGYQITLRGHSSDAGHVCTGQQVFSVRSGQVTSVEMILACAPAAPKVSNDLAEHAADGEQS